MIVVRTDARPFIVGRTSSTGLWAMLELTSILAMLDPDKYEHIMFSTIKSCSPSDFIHLEEEIWGNAKENCLMQTKCDWVNGHIAVVPDAEPELDETIEKLLNSIECIATYDFSEIRNSETLHMITVFADLVETID